VFQADGKQIWLSLLTHHEHINMTLHR